MFLEERVYIQSTAEVRKKEAIFACCWLINQYLITFTKLEQIKLLYHPNLASMPQFDVMLCFLEWRRIIWSQQTLRRSTHAP